MSEKVYNFSDKQQIVTRADDNYPKKLKNKLHHNCPPLFYCAGNLSLLKKKCIGYVGSRKITPEDAAFTVSTVSKTLSNQFAVVSGGAKGVDSISTEVAISSGGFSIEYLGESMLKRMKTPLLLKAIQNGQLLLISFVVPDAGFFAGNLMARNKYIYAQSDGTVIVRSEKKGGTWSGATENLRHKWAPAFCWDKPEYVGNQELIKRGCIPIDETWNGNPEKEKNERKTSESSEGGIEAPSEQLLIPGFE